MDPNVYINFILANVFTITLIVALIQILEKLKLINLFLKAFIKVIMLFSFALVAAIISLFFLNFEYLIYLCFVAYGISFIYYIIQIVKISFYIKYYRTNVWQEIKERYFFFPKLKKDKLEEQVKELQRKTTIKERDYSISIPEITLTDNEKNKIKNGYSILILYEYNVNIGAITGGILSNFLIEPKKDFVKRDYINYICGDKPPFIINNFILNYIRDNTIIKNPKIICFSNRIYYIDAYTENFSFDESIFNDNIAFLKNINKLNILPAKNLGEIHSKTVDSFKMMVKNMEDRSKRPSVCNVYDTLSSLKDSCNVNHLETYYSHCLVAEKQYKMITFILERKDADVDYINTLKYLVDGVIEYSLDKDKKLIGKKEKF